MAHLAKLIAEILQRERIRLQLPVNLHRFLFVDGLLGLFDERQDVAHAENAGNDAVGVKYLEGIVLLTDADKLYRLASDVMN